MQHTDMYIYSAQCPQLSSSNDKLPSNAGESDESSGILLCKGPQIFRIRGYVCTLGYNCRKPRMKLWIPAQFRIVAWAVYKV